MGRIWKHMASVVSCLVNYLIMRKLFLPVLVTAAMFVSHASSAGNKVSLDSGSGIAEWKLHPADVVLDGDALHRVGVESDGWIPAIVPGAAFASYVEAGLEPDPNYGDNAYRIDREKYDKDYWYRVEIPSSSIPDGTRRWLCFEGVNRKGEIWFNGECLGQLDGFMDRGRFEITSLVKNDGTPNVLAVLVRSPKDPIPNYASPTYISSAGWDWMPYVPGLLGGITDDVYMETSGDIVIEDPWVRTKVPAIDRGLVSVTAGLVNNSREDREVTVTGVLVPGDIRFEKTVKVQAGRKVMCSFTPDEFPQLGLDNPALWWPNGYGDQNLYTCILTCAVDGQESYRSDFTFGIREYSYDFVKGVFQLSVNGEKIYCKGGNWGMSEWMLRCRGEEYDLKVRLHKEMNMNMIRNWIGSTTDDEFYQACDKYGIMVFDDFWLNSHPNLPDDVFAFNRNAVEKIKRLRNHPCIAVWCGDNEGVPLAPLNEWLREDVRTFDGGDRWYQPISREYGFSGSGPWVNAHPIWYFTEYPSGFGDHKLDGWGFRTEIGTAVFTNYESYRKFMPDPEQWPMSEEMLNRHFFGASSFNSRPDRYFATVEYNYGKASGTEDFCRKAQLLNIEANKAMFEGWQHHMWNDASGILTWMSQSAYPSFVWQTYDYYYDLNGAYWGVKKACEPVHVQWSYADNSIKVVNASLGSYDGLTVDARVYDINGNELDSYSKRVSASVRPDMAVKVMSLDFPEDGNLARGKKAFSSSDGVRDYLDASAVTDGNTGSAWSAQKGEGQWICVDMEDTVEVSEFVLSWESLVSEGYQILSSDNASDWTVLYTSEIGSEPIQKIGIAPVKARYFKVLNLKGKRNMAMHEIEIYGPSSDETQAGGLTPVHFIRLSLTDRDGLLLSENFYWRSLRLGDYTALNSLEPARLGVKTSVSEKDGKCTVTADVSNKGKGVAFAVRVMPVLASSGEQILPAIMDDNYFTLMKGETKKVTIEFDSSLLEGDDVRIVVRPYND